MSTWSAYIPWLSRLDMIDSSASPEASMTEISRGVIPEAAWCDLDSGRRMTPKVPSLHPRVQP